MLHTNTDKKFVNVRKRHQKKLLNLGIDVSKKIKPEKVIFYLSNRKVTTEESELLALGLDFGFPIMNMKY